MAVIRDWMGDVSGNPPTEGSAQPNVHAHILKKQNIVHYCNNGSHLNKRDSFQLYSYTGLFISSSGISELECATTKTDTAERSISIGRETLQVFFCIRGLGVLPGSTARG